MLDVVHVTEENDDGETIRQWLIQSSDEGHKHTLIYRDSENGCTIILSLPDKLIEEMRKMRGY